MGDPRNPRPVFRRLSSRRFSVGDRGFSKQRSGRRYIVIDTDRDPAGGTVTIYQYLGQTKEVAVPAVYGGKPVTGLYNRAFSGTKVTNVVIPPGVVHFGDELFAFCSDLVEVDFPEGTEKLSDRMFWHCDSLAEAALPSTLRDIRNAFRDCRSLVRVELPPGLTDMAGAFSGCTALESVEIPDSVTDMAGAFEGCTALTRVTVPRRVKEMDAYDFAGCRALQYICVAENNSYMRSIDGVVYSKDGTTLLRIPCGRTGELVIPEGVLAVAPRAAFDCEGLTRVVLPASLRQIGEGAFHPSVQLTGSFERDGQGVTYNGDALVSADPETLTGSYAVRPGTRTVAERAFAECRRLTAVILPDTVTDVGAYAFQGCVALRDITFPQGVRLGLGVFEGTGYSLDPANYDESGVLYLNGYLIRADADRLTGSYAVRPGTKVIAAGAIIDCHSLTELVIPEGVTHIARFACFHCLGLETVVLPRSIALIDPSVFVYCHNLKSIYYASTREDWREVDFDPGTVPVACLGDADGDGKITSTDARLALQLTAGKIGEGDLADPGAMDVDGDDAITTTDARLILQRSAGKNTDWP